MNGSDTIRCHRLFSGEGKNKWYMTLQKAEHTWEKCRRESWPPKFRTDFIECFFGKIFHTA
jgi:hypothetical protein